ncbi:MAG: hypothetical protein ACK5T2_17340 [bacterium]|jgi:hypothetical protein
MSRVFRRSTGVPLLLAGTLLAGCDQAPVPLRDIYARDSDCKLDWGDNGRCEEASTTGGGHGWYGPVYNHGRRDTGGRDNRFGVIDTRNGNVEYGRGSALLQNWNARAAAASRSSQVAGDGSTTRGGFGTSARSSSGG